jgi:hypothetical protein
VSGRCTGNRGCSLQRTIRYKQIIFKPVIPILFDKSLSVLCFKYVLHLFNATRWKNRTNYDLQIRMSFVCVLVGRFLYVCSSVCIWAHIQIEI